MPKAYASTVVNAAADQVWAAIRAFNGLRAHLPLLQALSANAGAARCLRSPPCPTCRESPTQPRKPRSAGSSTS